MGIYLLTGSNRGIGYEYCRQLKLRGEDVIATCRESSKDLEELGVRVETGVDIADSNTIKKLKNKLKGIKIDVLIQNAAIAQRNSLDGLNVSSIRNQLEVNAIAPLRLVNEMLDHLISGSKVILMSSRMGSIEDNSSGGSYGYRMSKAALCMAGKSLSIDLKERGISVGILHPGLVSTRMTGYTQEGITPEQSVKGLIKRIDSLNINNTGSFIHSNGSIIPW